MLVFVIYAICRLPSWVCGSWFEILICQLGRSVACVLEQRPELLVFLLCLPTACICYRALSFQQEARANKSWYSVAIAPVWFLYPTVTVRVAIYHRQVIHQLTYRYISIPDLSFHPETNIQLLSLCSIVLYDAITWCNVLHLHFRCEFV